MKIVSNIKEWQQIRSQLPEKSIGFIPTMGNLHQGHRSLCDVSIENNAITVVSIFINPTQFNEPMDFENYPRTLEKDIEVLSQLNVDYLLNFNEKQLYPDNYEIKLSEMNISQLLEGQYRPGHFEGMLTIVLKLLNLVNPTHAYFGKKDYQQYILIKKMVEALFLNIQIIPCDTIRNEQGLALSSRNSKLNAAQIEKAAYFPKLLNSEISPDIIAEHLTKEGFKVDYIADYWNRRLGAVWLDGIRLIDNFPKI